MQLQTGGKQLNWAISSQGPIFLIELNFTVDKSGDSVIGLLSVIVGVRRHMTTEMKREREREHCMRAGYVTSSVSLLTRSRSNGIAATKSMRNHPLK